MDTSISAHDKRVLNRLFNPEMPDIDESLTVEETTPEGNYGYSSETIEKLKFMQLEAIKLVDEDKQVEALTIFDSIIRDYDNYAPVYNDRAQLFQLLSRREEALVDLKKTISLCQGRGQIAALAYTQMGIIFHVEGREDDARDAFNHGAELGSAFAKQMAVKLNPYAALCNQMLQKMIQELSHPPCSGDQ